MKDVASLSTSSTVSDSDDSRYRTLVNSITDYAIYMLEGRDASAAGMRVLSGRKGYSASEIIGEHFSRFYTEEDRQRGVPARALRIAATEGRYETEGWRVRKDGSASGLMSSSIRSSIPRRVLWSDSQRSHAT